MSKKNIKKFNEFDSQRMLESCGGGSSDDNQATANGIRRGRERQEEVRRAMMLRDEKRRKLLKKLSDEEKAKIKVCPSCKEKLEGEEKFSPECGYKIPNKKTESED